jgi:hypothetical protein
MGGQEGAKLDEARLLGAKSGNRGLNLGIAPYRLARRLSEVQTRMLRRPSRRAPQ